MIAEEMEARVEELRRNNRELHQEILAMGQRLNTAQVMIKVFGGSLNKRAIEIGKCISRLVGWRGTIRLP